jgi:ketosteroid isomerase-like protein
MLPLITAFLILYACDAVPKDDDNNDSKIGANSAFNKDAVRDSIEAANVVFTQAMLKGDSTAGADNYTSDAKVMGPNMPSVSGRDGITGFAGEFSRMGLKDFKLNVVDIWGNEDMVVEEGTYTMGDDKGNTVDKGKYIAIWKKENGKWKIFRDIFNSDNPMPGSH